GLRTNFRGRGRESAFVIEGGRADACYKSKAVDERPRDGGGGGRRAARAERARDSAAAASKTRDPAPPRFSSRLDASRARPRIRTHAPILRAIPGPHSLWHRHDARGRLVPERVPLLPNRRRAFRLLGRAGAGPLENLWPRASRRSSREGLSFERRTNFRPVQRGVSVLGEESQVVKELKVCPQMRAGRVRFRRARPSSLAPPWNIALLALVVTLSGCKTA